MGAYPPATKPRVLLFTKTYCSYCQQVKALFKELNQEVVVFDLDVREDGLALQVALSAKTGISTTPQVFVRGVFVGGNSDTLEKHRDGTLAKMLQG